MLSLTNTKIKTLIFAAILLAALSFFPALSNDAYADEGKQLVENSWRYDNGQPVLQETENANAGIALLSLEDGDTSGAAWGIDVSEHQGYIDWDQIKASGIDFAIIRVGFSGYDYGGRADKKWERNVSECERLGIPYGVYLYSYAESYAEASNEADLALSLLQGHNPQLPVYYDLEDRIIPTSQVATLATAFCSKIERAGYRAGVYASLSWWNSYLTSSVFDQWDRWVAQWNYRCDYSGAYSVWQNSDDGAVAGIDGYVDTNYWNGEFPYYDEDDDGQWITENGKTYYLDKDGNICKGERLISDHWYHFDEFDGAMTTGFCDLGTKTVYYDEAGRMLYGEQAISDHWYHFDEFDGAMTTGFCDLGTKTVYYDEAGRMLYGEQFIAGRWYHFDEFDGAML